MNEAARNADLLATLRSDGRQQSRPAPCLVPPDKATGQEIAARVAERIGHPVID